MTIDGKERKVINYKNFLFGEEEQTIDNLREQNEQLKEILSIREQQLLSLVNANSSYSERMEHYVELAKKADADKEMIQNSEFWKMTKPVRLLTDILKKDKVSRFPEKIQFSATIQTFEDIVKYFERGDRKIIGKKQLIAYGKKETKKVLLVTHEMMLTGAPIALFYFAKMLKEEEMCPVILAPSGGMLEDECKRYGIPALIDPSLYKEKRYKLYIDLFDMVIANTIASAPVINGLSESRIPVLWWLHEAEASYQDENFFKAMPQHIPDNVTVYTVGDYAKKRLLYHRPLYKSKELLYYVPQNNVEGKDVTFKLPKEAKGKTVFALIGVQEYRKGFDILINAIRNLNEEERKKSYFVFVGKKYYKTIYEDIDQICKDFPENTLYIEKLDRKEINDLYKEIDCYICASRDDPMPIVVTEAMQNNVAVIVSENTGTATIVKTEKCGLTYKNNNVEELTEKIIYKYMNNQRYFAGRPLKSKDEVVNDCVQRCQKYCMVNYKGDYSILEGLKEYISTSLKNYFEINEYTKGNSDKIEKELIESINDCIEKQMSVWFGVELSRLRYNICLYNEFGDLLMGV